MTKPSEILKEKLLDNNIYKDEITTEMKVLMEYLDEEWEKNKPCEHDGVKSFCNKCRC